MGIRCYAIAYVIELEEVSCPEKISSEISTCCVNVNCLHQMLSPLQKATSARHNNCFFSFYCLIPSYL